MGLISPTGNITLYKDVPFAPNYTHSIHFNSPGDQTAYFNSKKLQDGSLSNQNYVKSEEGKIRVQIANYGVQGASNINIDNASYMSWKNTDSGNNFEDTITFYAFITDISMISINVVEISYQVDVLQTYVIQGKVTFENCFIERWTPSIDTVGHHIEPEPVSIGNKIFQNRDAFSEIDGSYSNYRPVVWSTFNLSQIGSAPRIDPMTMGRACGAYQGLFCTIFRDMSAFESLMREVNEWTEQAYTFVMNNIVCITAIPQRFAVMENPNLAWSAASRANSIDDYHASHKFHKHIDGALDGYIPKYNKLYTYPFNGFYITNNDGETQEYRYEFFSGDMKFEAYSALQPNFEVIVYPLNYGGESAVFDKAISLRDFPQVPWISDSYKMWLANSKTAYSMQTYSALMGSLVSAASGNGFGAAALASSAIQQYKSYTVEKNAASLAPDNVHQGANNAKTIANGKQIIGYQHCVNYYDAKRIDQYFDMFGYAVNQIDKPGHSIVASRKHRYIKTAGCLVHGTCPSEYLRQIENIFNSGVTWWDKDHIGEYPTEETE